MFDCADDFAAYACTYSQAPSSRPRKAARLLISCGLIGFPEATSAATAARSRPRYSLMTQTKCLKFCRLDNRDWMSSSFIAAATRRFWLAAISAVMVGAHCDTQVCSRAL